jgi:glycosyltransferase involved in cell wall biosynthesis
MEKTLSLVIPVYNEEENLRPLFSEIKQALDPLDLTYEVIFVDDGSTDGSFTVMQALHQANPHVIAIRLRRNHGQTAAFAAGFDHAQGHYILTIDADRQNDPADIPQLLAKIEEGEGYDVVNGWRQNRQDSLVLRKIPSYVANRLIARLTRVPLHDRGCSLRLFRAEVIQELNLYGELHRFIPELVNFAGFRMAEVPVNHRPRLAGRSKYGLSRTLRVLLDLVTIVFLRRYTDRPMQLFGAMGILSGGAGTLIGLYLSGLKIMAGLRHGWPGFHATQIGDRPLLLLAVLLVIIGVQFLVLGVLAELIVRTYYETQQKPIYHVRDVLGGSSDPSSSARNR